MYLIYSNSIYPRKYYTTKKRKEGGGEEREKERETWGGVLAHGIYTIKFSEYII